MKCDFCEQKATVFLTQITDGEMKKYSLCEQCSNEKGVSDPLQMSMNEQFFSTEDKVPDSIKEVVSPIDAILAEAENVDCAACGFTLNDLKKIGRLGCPECYNIFRSQIMGNLSKMHKATTHIGTAPAGMRETLARQAAVDELQLQLNKAISDEDYEKAAELRDALKMESATPETSDSPT